LRQQSDSTPTVVVTGLGGVGKTALLTELCHRHRQDFQLIRWIVASSREATIGALLSLASALNVDTTRLSAEDAIRPTYEALGSFTGRWLLVSAESGHYWRGQRASSGGKGWASAGMPSETVLRLCIHAHR
jgi:hypothetical protein